MEKKNNPAAIFLILLCSLIALVVSIFVVQAAWYYFWAAFPGATLTGIVQDRISLGTSAAIIFVSAVITGRRALKKKIDEVKK